MIAGALRVGGRLKALIIVRGAARCNSDENARPALERFRPVKSGDIARSIVLYNVSYMKPFPFGAILGEFEQLVLLALLRLGNGAFGAAIHREIVTRTGRDLPASAVYVTLDRLETKRMVCSYIGTPTRQRGGRRRKHYLLDTAGQRALVRAYRTFGAMTAGLQAELEDLTQRMTPGFSATKPTSRPSGW
jgi:PadR family transcriptional regulator, regulatory protein PadR